MFVARTVKDVKSHMPPGSRRENGKNAKTCSVLLLRILSEPSLMSAGLLLIILSASFWGSNCSWRITVRAKYLSLT